MYHRRIQATALTIIYLANVSSGLILDASCNTYQNLFVTSFNHAFLAGENAASQLNANMDPSIANLATWLFGPTSNWAEADSRLSGVKNIPWTGSFTTDKTDKSNTNNIIVYCDLDRYVTPSDPQKVAAGLHYDPDNGVYSDVNDADFQACKTGSAAIGQKPPKAITSNYRELDLRKTPPLTTMEICPWYLQKTASSEWQMGSDFNIWGVLGQLANLPQTIFGGNTDMDTFNLFDFTILHELTHSRACGLPQKELLIPEVYGWTGCVQAKNPANSESLAMFALGVEKIQTGYTLLQDGEVLTRAQVNAIDPPPSPDSISGHSDGSSSPGIDDPDSPAPGSGSSSGGKRDLGMTAKKGYLVAAQRFRA